MSSVCKFYQQGNCRYGTSCRFQHAGTSSSNVFGKASTDNTALYNRFTDPNRFSYTPSSTDAKMDPQTAVVEAIKADFQSWISSKIWPLSCYNPAGATFLFEDLKDVSFEEARLEAYKAIAAGTKDAFIEGFNAEMLKVKNIIETVVKMDNQSLLGLIKTNTGTPAVINSHAGSTSVFGTSTTNAFRSATTSNAPATNAFGSAATSIANAFGTTSTATNNPFAANPSATSSNIFATSQPSQSSNMFATSQSTFGQTTPAFGTAAPAFGATPALPAAQPFGQAAPTSSVFGQSAAPAATFGQTASATSFGQVASSNSSVFAAPSTATSNPFASQGAQSGFGAVAQAAPQATAFGQPTATFGQQPAASGGLFGQPAASTTSTFGQPTATATFGQPAATTTSTFGQPATSTFGQPTASTGFGQPATTAAPFGQAAATAHIQPAQSGFGLSAQSAAPAATSGFGAVAAKPQAANPFGSSQPKQESPPAPKSELIPELTELCLTQYRLEQFTVGKIPECPPPPELCV